MVDGTTVILGAIRLGDELLDRAVTVWLKGSEAIIAAAILGIAVGTTLGVALVGALAMVAPRIADVVGPHVARAATAVRSGGRSVAGAVERVLTDEFDLDNPDAVADALASAHANAKALEHTLDESDARTRSQATTWTRVRDRIRAHCARALGEFEDVDRVDVDHLVLRSLDGLLSACSRLVNGGAHDLGRRVARSTWWPAVVAVIAVSRVSPRPIALGILAAGVITGLATAWRAFLQYRDEETELSTGRARTFVEDVLREDLGVEIELTRLRGGVR